MSMASSAHAANAADSSGLRSRVRTYFHPEVVRTDDHLAAFREAFAAAFPAVTGCRPCSLATTGEPLETPADVFRAAVDEEVDCCERARERGVTMVSLVARTVATYADLDEFSPPGALAAGDPRRFVRELFARHDRLR